MKNKIINLLLLLSWNAAVVSIVVFALVRDIIFIALYPLRSS